MRAVACSILYFANLFDYHFIEVSEGGRITTGAFSILFLVAAAAFLLMDKPAP